MNKFKLSSGGYDILDYGVVYSFGKNEDIEYEMDVVAIKDPEIRFKMKIVFQFRDDGKEVQIERRVEGETVYFICYNFNNKLGTGTNEPVELAMVAGRRLYIHLWVVMQGETTRKIEYTTYFEKAGES